MELLLIFTVFLIFKVELICPQSCDEYGECDQGQNKYFNEVDNKIFASIKEATSKYVHCNSTKCSCHNEVLNDDLKPFEKGIVKKMINDVQSKGVLYQIIDNRIYRQKDCNFPVRCSGVEHFIKQVLKKVKLPNMELVINVRDYPQVLKNYGPHGPVLSFSKTDDYEDIMYPAWSFYEGGPAISLYPSGLGRWDLHRDSLIAASKKYPWKAKKNKTFFRGSRTSDERDSLILLSRSHPKLVDAQYTKNQAWKSPADTLNAEPAEEVSLEDHCKYKFLFNFRGIAASFRFKHLFLCKSLVFHVGNEWQEFFYKSIKPWVHYIPVDKKSNPEELKKLIDFFTDHQDIAEEIANRGYAMILQNLKFKDVECYWRKLLRNYGKLMKYEVEKDESLMEIK